MWNEEPYFSNLIPIIFVFTFVYSIILYAFSKVTESNMLVSNHMIKCPVLGVIEAVIQKTSCITAITLEYQYLKLL